MLRRITDVLSEGVIKVMAKMGISTVQSKGHKYLKRLACLMM
ncbi:glutamate synthase central domain-containing protein [Staphylococcus aureus]